MPQQPEAEEQTPQAIQQVLDGQQQLADLMTRLILLVQSPRKRVPVRNKAGDIEHVIDTIEPGATLQ